MRPSVLNIDCPACGAPAGYPCNDPAPGVAAKEVCGDRADVVQAVRPSVIKQWECSECGESTDWVHPDEDRYACSTHVDAGVAERVYWAADEVLEALEQHYIHNTVCGDFKLSIKVLERRFSGEGAS